MIRCLCPKCTEVVGNFAAFDDHGAILVECPKCEAELVVHNAVLDQAADAGEDEVKLQYHAM